MTGSETRQGKNLREFGEGKIEETAALLSLGKAQEALVTARRILSTLQQHQRLCAPAASGGAGKGEC